MIIVLWMVALISVIASSFAYSMRSELMLARNLVSSSQSQALADAGIQRAMYEMAKPASDTQRWQANGLRHEFSLAGAKIAVTMRDESGKIDINTAPDALLKMVLTSAGMNESQSAMVVDAILDWRDKDDLKRPLGAEVNDYIAAGFKFRPSNGPFETVEELQHVMGMSPGLYARISEMLTVFSKQPGFNPAFASRDVLRVVPGMEASQLDAYLMQRKQNLENGLPAPSFPIVGSYLLQSSSQIVSVRSEARLADGTLFVRDAVLKANPSGKQAYLFLRWAEGTVRDTRN